MSVEEDGVLYRLIFWPVPILFPSEYASVDRGHVTDAYKRQMARQLHRNAKNFNLDRIVFKLACVIVLIARLVNIIVEDIFSIGNKN